MCTCQNEIMREHMHSPLVMLGGLEMVQVGGL